MQEEKSVNDKKASLIDKRGMKERQEFLYKQGSMISRKRENQKLELLKKEMTELSGPSLSKKTLTIVNNQTRIGKIEDRLLTAGQRSQKLAQDKHSILEKELKNQAIPSITLLATQISRDDDIVDRLTLYQKIYTDKKKQASKEAEIEYSFQPVINKNFASSRPSLSRARSVATFREEFPFSPTLDENSIKIASKLGPFGSRNTQHIRIEVEEFTFKPSINRSKSKERSESPRWRSLYDLNVQRREKIELLRKDFETSRKDLECTFQPKTSKPSTAVDPSNTIQRLLNWKKLKESKIQEIQESKKNEDLESCTFKPALQAKPIIDEDENFAKKSVQDLIDKLSKKKTEKPEATYKENFQRKQEYRNRKFEINDMSIPLIDGDINSLQYDDAIKELHDLLHKYN